MASDVRSRHTLRKKQMWMGVKREALHHHGILSARKTSRWGNFSLSPEYLWGSCKFAWHSHPKNSQISIARRHTKKERISRSTLLTRDRCRNSDGTDRQWWISRHIIAETLNISLETIYIYLSWLDSALRTLCWIPHTLTDNLKPVPVNRYFDMLSALRIQKHD
jgi:hypothetical protein